VYIGFGSIVVDDPDGLTKILLEAIKLTGVRALISKGWGGLGKEGFHMPDNVYILGNVPHDWLFRHVSCVVHHGGAGTTATGVAYGKPTVIVPFFGDQPFWGAMIAKAGAGPEPIPYKSLTADRLADAIMTALKPSSLAAAERLADKIGSEHGIETTVNDFHRALEMDDLKCDLAHNHIAVWRIKGTNIKLSAFAAKVLDEKGLLSLNDLTL
jgi:UDP:flavonoid glycosyltransferase YjiC (YdhE family)